MRYARSPGCAVGRPVFYVFVSAGDCQKLVAVIGGGMEVEYAYVDVNPFKPASPEAACLIVKSSTVLCDGGRGSQSLSREGMQMWLNSHLMNKGQTSDAVDALKPGCISIFMVSTAIPQSHTTLGWI